MTDENNVFEVSDETERIELELRMALTEADGDDDFPTAEANALIEAAAEEDSTPYDAHVAELISGEHPMNKREVKGQIQDVRQAGREGRLEIQDITQYAPSNPSEDPVLEVDVTIQGEQGLVECAPSDLLRQERFRERVLTETGVMPDKLPDEDWNDRMEYMINSVDIDVVEEEKASPADEAAEILLNSLQTLTPVEEPGQIPATTGKAGWHDIDAGTFWVPAKQASAACEKAYGDPSVFDLLGVLETEGYLVDQTMDTLPTPGQTRIVGLSVDALISEDVLSASYFDPSEGDATGVDI